MMKIDDRIFRFDEFIKTTGKFIGNRKVSDIIYYNGVFGFVRHEDYFLPVSYVEKNLETYFLILTPIDYIINFSKILDNVNISLKGNNIFSYNLQNLKHTFEDILSESEYFLVNKKFLNMLYRDESKIKIFSDKEKLYKLKILSDIVDSKRNVMLDKSKLSSIRKENSSHEGIVEIENGIKIYSHDLFLGISSLSVYEDLKFNDVEIKLLVYEIIKKDYKVNVYRIKSRLIDER